MNFEPIGRAIERGIVWPRALSSSCYTRNVRLYLGSILGTLGSYLYKCQIEPRGTMIVRQEGRPTARTVRGDGPTLVWIEQLPDACSYTLSLNVSAPLLV